MEYIGLALILTLSTISYQAVAHDKDAESASMMGTPESTLEAYRSGIESLDDTNMPRLFTDDALVFENGKAEGSLAIILPIISVLNSKSLRALHSTMRLSIYLS
jgi:hypothetical protein